MHYAGNRECEGWCIMPEIENARGDALRLKSRRNQR
jgi:hypothetical protein